MEQTAPLILLFLISGGCHYAAAPTTVESAADNTADAIFTTLTARSWRSRPPGEQRGPGPDYRVTTFMPDGRWSTQHVTDF